jgi:2-keto-3-deoxy-L-rhamnonate aldolase RhmA
MRDIVDEANRTVTVIAQIEDREALDELDAIAAVEGIDALFVGRMDLTVSMGAQTPDDASVVDAVRAVVNSARRHGVAVGMFTATVEQARQWSAEGVSLFLLASDQQWVLQGAHALVANFRGT